MRLRIGRSRGFGKTPLKRERSCSAKYELDMTVSVSQIDTLHRAIPSAMLW